MELAETNNAPGSCIFTARDIESTIQGPICFQDHGSCSETLNFIFDLKAQKLIRVLLDTKG